MAIVEVKIQIEGTTPLLMNKFNASQKGGISNSDKGTPFEQAEQKLYVGLGGKVMIPQPNVFRCIIDAGCFFKLGKSTITTQKKSLIPACVDVRGAELPLIHKEPWTIDERAVVIPSTGGRIICYRPKFNDWILPFEVELDTDFINLKLFRDLVDASGKRVGLGDFRPGKKGPYGKFVVKTWQAKTLGGETKVEPPKKCKKAA